jgi:hypothetical protein
MENYQGGIGDLFLMTKIQTTNSSKIFYKKIENIHKFQVRVSTLIQQVEMRREIHCLARKNCMKS